MTVDKKLSEHRFEHSKSFFTFFYSLLLSAFSALFLGRIIEKTIEKVQGTKQSRWESFLFLLIQFCIIIVLIFASFKVIKIYKLHFDDWLLGTFDGYFFTLIFAITQETLAKNAKSFFI